MEYLGNCRLMRDPDLTSSYEQDATGRFGGTASAVALPESTEQVAAVVATCSEHGIPVVPQGGNTGLVGGGVPRGGELVLSLRGLKDLGAVDVNAAQVVVGAGVTLEELQQHVRAAGFEVGIDFGARSGATIGGMTATNAGGALAMRYGTMRAQVGGLEAVLADGTVVSRLSGVLKDNAGYDLPAALIGSEGTLAVFTKVLVRLVPQHAHRIVILFGLDSFADALALFAVLRRQVGSLVAVDFFDRAGLKRVRQHRGLRAPFERDWGLYLVVECRADRDPTEELADAVGELGQEVDVAFADDSAGREALWAYRELQNEAIAAAGVPHKLDVSVGIAALPEFAVEVGELIEATLPGSETILYGHLGDGNVHVNVLGPGPGDNQVDQVVLELAGRYGGSISAEHGVGVAKRDYLRLSRSAGEIATMERLKAAVDPAWVLNPGCVLPSPNEEGRSASNIEAASAGADRWTP